MPSDAACDGEIPLRSLGEYCIPAIPTAIGCRRHVGCSGNVVDSGLIQTTKMELSAQDRITSPVFSVVLVTYNSADVVAEAIASVPPGNQVIVVDNASSDRSADIAQAAGATVLRLPQNLGFGTGCNRGSAVATSEKLLFLNPDATLAPDALLILANAFDRNPHAAMFGPRIMLPDGTQFFRRRSLLLPRPYLFRPPIPDRDCDVVNLSGAALAMRKTIFDALGGFDEDIFLYLEDDDLCARTIKAGHALRYVHGALVHHQRGSSTRKTAELNSFLDYHALRSQAFVFRKHGVMFLRRPRIVQEYIRLLTAKLMGNAARETRAAVRLKALLGKPLSAIGEN